MKIKHFQITSKMCSRALQYFKHINKKYEKEDREAKFLHHTDEKKKKIFSIRAMNSKSCFNALYSNVMATLYLLVIDIGKPIPGLYMRFQMSW